MIVILFYRNIKILRLKFSREIVFICILYITIPVLLAQSKVMKMIRGRVLVYTCVCLMPGILITILIDIKMTFS